MMNFLIALPEATPNSATGPGRVTASHAAAHSRFLAATLSTLHTALIGKFEGGAGCAKQFSHPALTLRTINFLDRVADMPLLLEFAVLTPVVEDNHQIIAF
jgi:hypothetical protein